MASKNLCSSLGNVLNRVQQQPKRQFASVFNNDNGKIESIDDRKTKFHLTAQQKYPAAEPLPLPANIDPTETTKFSRERNRDITTTAILSHQSNCSQNRFDFTLIQDAIESDPHVQSYDCSGSVHLNSVMQSNVPNPFGGLRGFTHLNMPGGQWSQESKFMSHNLQNSHYTNLRQQARAEWSKYDENATANTAESSSTAADIGANEKKSGTRLCTRIGNFQIALKRNFHLHASPIMKQLTPLLSVCDSTNNCVALFPHRSFSQDNKTSPIKNSSIVETTKPTTEQVDLVEKSKQSKESQSDDTKLTRREQLKRAVKEYGSTVIVFHIAISLVSLEIFYLLVSSGIDVMPIVNFIGLGSTALSNKIASGASTFVIAYAIHKVFAPLRISMTLFASPLIVRYLRRKGILKPKKTS